MKIKCSNCPKVLVIPDDRLPKGKTLIFPCPDCHGKIRINADMTDTLRDPAPPKERLTGDGLKKKIIDTVQDLPPMPQTVLMAREIMDDPKAGFKELADLFESDQAMAARILKLANSSYYAMRGEITSIQRAAVVLGHKTLAELVTMGGVASLLGDKLEGYGLDVNDLWKHSLAVAFGSRFIAGKVAPDLANDAFTAGLLHDAGKLILDRYIIERWQDFEAFLAPGDHSFLEAEKEVLALDHPEIAFEVCKAWRIPSTLTQAIRYHHYPSQSKEILLTSIVHIADAVALMASIGAGIDGTMYRVEDSARSVVGFGEDQLGEVMHHMLTAANKLAAAQPG